jgi:hypothetical protein
MVRRKTADETDRTACALKIQKLWRMTRSSNNPVFIDMGVFIKNAMRVSQYDEVRRSEIQWRHIISQATAMPDMLPLLDLSLFEDQSDRFYEALGLACIVAMKSSKRIMLFDQSTYFVSIENCTSLQDILSMLRPIIYEHHIGQNIKAVCDTLLLSIRETNLAKEDVQKMKLAFFTHFDRIDLFQNIVRETFENAGFDVVPFLLLWKATKKVSVQQPSSIVVPPRTFVFSGNSNYALTRISSLPPEAWNNMNAFDFVAFLLNQPRYDNFETYLQ